MVILSDANMVSLKNTEDIDGGSNASISEMIVMMDGKLG